jgi:UDP-2,3-diacylglucosamine pyrophosphatase LpxH
MSWAQLKEKFLVNFQGFQVDITTEEDFFSYQQYEREKLPDFFHRFLQFKVQTSEVSDEQAITQAIKALCAGQLHSHLVRECPKTLEGLYEEFRKFSRSEVSHYRKWDQQESNK